jgi:hypothetical protein
MLVLVFFIHRRETFNRRHLTAKLAVLTGSVSYAAVTLRDFSLIRRLVATYLGLARPSIF